MVRLLITLLLLVVGSAQAVSLVDGRLSVDVKPDMRVTLDSAHPLSRRLIAYFTMNENGKPVNLVSNQSSGTFVGSWQLTALGVSTRYNGSSNYLAIPLNLSLANKLTIITRLKWDTFANDDAVFCEFTSSITNAGSFIVVPNSSSTGGFYLVASKGVGAANFNGGHFTRPSGGVYHDYVFEFNRTVGGGLNVAAWVDGLSQSITQDNVADLTGTNFANDILYLMSRGATSLFAAGNIAYLGIYDRLLSQNEIRLLQSNPYGHLRVRAPIDRFSKIQITPGTGISRSRLQGGM